MWSALQSASLHHKNHQVLLKYFVTLCSEFSKGFQSISPQSDYKVIRNSFLSFHLQNTLKVLGGIGGVEKMND